MNTFKDREKGFEKKFANDQEAEFKISAKRNKLLAGWVADILKYDEEKKKNYIVEVIKADFQEAGDEDVIRKIKKDKGGRHRPRSAPRGSPAHRVSGGRACSGPGSG